MNNYLLKYGSINFIYVMIILFIGISLVCGSIFIINQIDDLEVDRVNNKASIIDDYISREKALLISNIICFSGFLLTCF